MTLTCEMVKDPPEDLQRQMQLLRETDPFLTPQFMKGQTKFGYQSYAFLIKESGTVVEAFYGYLKKARLGHWFEIRCLPVLPPDSPFWALLLKKCRQMRIADVEIRALSDVPIPPLAGMTQSRKGVEYLWNFDRDDLLAPKAAGHRNSLARARKAGLRLERSVDPACIDEHVRLMGASLSRRTARGEVVPERINRQYFECMLSTGAGAFFRAMGPDSGPFSSMFALESSKGGYYQAAGNSPEGMKMGASIFLLVETARHFQKEGKTCFDLGGTFPEDSSGLGYFKLGFGSEEKPFEEVYLSTATPGMRMLRNCFRAVRKLIRH